MEIYLIDKFASNIKCLKFIFFNHNKIYASSYYPEQYPGVFVFNIKGELIAEYTIPYRIKAFCNYKKNVLIFGFDYSKEPKDYSQHIYIPKGDFIVLDNEELVTSIVGRTYTAAAFHPEGSQIMLSSLSTLELFEIQDSGNPTKIEETESVQDDAIISMCFSENGTKLATLVHEESICFWDFPIKRPGNVFNISNIYATCSVKNQFIIGAKKETFYYFDHNKQRINRIKGGEPSNSTISCMCPIENDLLVGYWDGTIIRYSIK